MRPHEETWVLERASPTMRGKIVCGDDEVATLGMPYRSDGKWSTPQHALSMARGTLAAAAPDMARALLDLLPHWRAIVCTKTEAEAITRAEAALRRAGILP